MPNPSLPFELYQLIIQHTCDSAHSSRGQHPSLLREEVMPTDLKKTLASCLLVDQAFYRIARVLLFSSIYVTTGDSRAFIDKLIRILVHQHPDPSLVPLGRVVNRLTLDHGPPSYSAQSMEESTNVRARARALLERMRAVPFLAIARLFRTIRTHSSNLSSLSIISTTRKDQFGFRTSSPDTDWNLARIIIDTCHVPTLQSLTVEDCSSFPVHCLWNPSLRHLFLDRVTLDVSGNIIDGFGVPKAEWADTMEVGWQQCRILLDSRPLQSVKIRGLWVSHHMGGASVQDALGYVMLGVGSVESRELRQIYLDDGGHQVLRFPNLTTLVWPVERWGPPGAGSIYGLALSAHAPNLVTLQLEYDSTYPPGVGGSRPEPVALKPFTKLENLVVSIPKRSFQSIIGPLEQIITLLQPTDSEGFPPLKTVSIDIQFIIPTPALLFSADGSVRKYACQMESETHLEVEGWDKLARCMEANPAKVVVGVSLKSPVAPGDIERNVAEEAVRIARGYYDSVQNLLSKSRLNPAAPSL